MIEIGRGEIERFLDSEKIAYIIDSSNLKKDYLRNRIRLSIMPMLKELNPDVIETLSKTAAIFRDEERYFEFIVTKTLMKLISRKTDLRIELFLSPFEIMDKVIIRRVLRRAINETKGLRGISFIHIEDITELIKRGNAGDRLYLPEGIRVIKKYSTILLTSEPPVQLSACTLKIQSPKSSYSMPALLGAENLNPDGAERSGERQAFAFAGIGCNLARHRTSQGHAGLLSILRSGRGPADLLPLRSFASSRFAINTWICRDAPGQRAPDAAG